MDPIQGWKRNRRRVILAFVALWLAPAFCAGSLVGLSEYTGLMGASVTYASELRFTPEVSAIARCRDAVVNLRGEKLEAPEIGTDAAEDSERHIGMGTGIVVDARGYILTNYHVVADIREIQVVTCDNQWYEAKIVARDPDTDLAILKVEPQQPMTVIPIGRSDDLMQGERVIALGNAYGYEHTATFGYISATRRPVQINGAQFYEDLIQTDASINPGNSGGPLLNIDGELVGVNVAVRENAQGIGFAIPVDRAMRVASKLLVQTGERTACHGLTLDPETGCIVAVATASAAQEAGLRNGERIVKIGEIPMTCPLDPERTLLERKAGEALDVTVLQEDGNERSVVLTLTRPEPIAYANREGDASEERRVVVAKYPTQTDVAWELFGLALTPMPSAEVERVSGGDYNGALRVDAIRPDSPAAKQSVKVGDLLVGMQIGSQGYKTQRLSDITDILNRTSPQEKKIPFFLLRNGTFWSGSFPTGH